MMTLFSILIMSTIGLSLLYSVSNEGNSSNSEVLANQAYYAAEAGLEDAMDIIRGNRCPYGVANCSNNLASNQINLTIATTKSSSNKNSDTVNYARLSKWLNYTTSDDSGVVVLNPTQPAAYRLSYKLNLGAIDANGYVLITSTGYGPLGAQRTLRMRIKDGQSLLEASSLTAIPAAISLLGELPSATLGNSAVHTITGKDICPAGLTPATPDFEKPTVGAVKQNNANWAWTHGLSNRPQAYDTTFPLNPTSGYVVDISQQDVARHITGDIPFDNKPSKAEAFVQQVQQLPTTYVVNSNASVDASQLGTAAAPKAVVALGNLTLNASTPGTGLLIVKGNLTLSGNFTYNGLILVLGNGTVTRNGGGGGAINGGIIIGKYTASSDPSFNDSDFSQAASLVTNGGGNSAIQYCSTAVKMALSTVQGASVTAVNAQ